MFCCWVCLTSSFSVRSNWLWMIAPSQQGFCEAYPKRSRQRTECPCLNFCIINIMQPFWDRSAYGFKCGVTFIFPHLATDKCTYPFLVLQQLLRLVLIQLGAVMGVRPKRCKQKGLVFMRQIKRQEHNKMKSMQRATQKVCWEQVMLLVPEITYIVHIANVQEDGCVLKKT